MSWNPPAPPSSGGTGTVTSVAAADTSVVIGGTPTVAPTIRTATLDVIATDHPPAADWSNNSKKITALANGAAAQDAAAFGQIPTALPPNGTAGGVLSGSYPNPGMAAGAAVANIGAAGLPIADIANPGTGKVIGSSGGAAAAIVPPGTLLDSGTVTSSVTISATTEGTANLLVAGAGAIFDGAPVEISFYCTDLDVAPNAGGNRCFLVLYEDGVSIGPVADYLVGATTDLQFGGVGFTFPYTPSAGAHTYGMRAYRTNANCTAQCDVGGATKRWPMTLRIKKA